MLSARQLMTYGVINALAMQPTAAEKKRARKVRSTKCCECGSSIPPGRPGRKCKGCREGNRQPDMNTLMEQMDQGQR